MGTRPFAAFDLDGTLVRWQLYHAIVDELARLGSLSKDDAKKIHSARMNWKNRSPQSSFKTYEEALISVYRAKIKSIDPDLFEQATDNVFLSYKDQVYTSTRDLIKELKAKKYLLFAISGSQREVVAKMADYYGFDDFKGTVFETINGKFTGNVTAGYHNKDIALKELVEKNNASYKGSYAVGDSLSDSKMMDLVEHPIAFNPDADLLAYAKKNSWKIVIERKNVIYELERGSGETYILA